MPRILLVDDDDSFRKMLRLSLIRMGHDVAEARDGKEAVRLINEGPPDIMITDLVMPEKEGLETIDEVRRQYPGMKIIAMSGGGRVNASDYLKIARAMGADQVLAKPFSIDEITATLASVMAKAS
jgi:DNA-binding response OmpR family regulator